MRKYKVYLTTGETIEMLGDRIELHEAAGYLTIIQDYENVIAMYVLANICGWVEVKE